MRVSKAEFIGSFRLTLLRLQQRSIIQRPERFHTARAFFCSAEIFAAILDRTRIKPDVEDESNLLHPVSTLLHVNSLRAAGCGLFGGNSSTNSMARLVAR